MDMSFLPGEEHIDAGQHMFRKGMFTLRQDWVPSLAALRSVSPAVPVSPPASTSGSLCTWSCKISLT